MLVLVTMLALGGVFDDLDVREYPAFVENCYDGDTCTLTVDLGFNCMLWGQKVRLYGIDAPELQGSTKEAGIRSRDWLTLQVTGKQVRLQVLQQTNKFQQKYDQKGKYGRYLAIIVVGDRNMNKELVVAGLAVEKVY